MKQNENTNENKKRIFKRKEIKKAARKNLKHHYVRNIIIVFLTAFIINGGYILKTNNIDVAEIKFEDTTYIISSKKSNTEIIEEFFINHMDEEKSEPSTPKKAYQQGILNVFINEITKSGSTLFGFLNAFNELFLQNRVSQFIIIIIFTILSFLIYFLIQNIIDVGKNRYFLEQRKYLNVPVDRILFPYKVKKTLHIAYILFCKYIYQLLWNFTIIGGFIKHYEYFFVPYILSENPELTKKEVFKLSKELMYGEKWNTFKVDFSFIGWSIINNLTLGLVGIFYYYPYRECTYAELYITIRIAKKDSVANSDLLQDILLTSSDNAKRLYLDETVPSLINNKTTIKKLDYKQNYSIISYILMFFTFAFTGWCWEVFLHLANHGEFVNPGTLYGPWIPIYGVGLILVLILLKPFREKTSMLFVATVILCGVIEYFTGWYLETFRHLKWWDYTGYFLNIQGRVCLEVLIIFGLGGCAVTYIFAPLLNNVYEKIKPNVKKAICAILIILFVIDFTYSSKHPNSGDGITIPVENNVVESQKGNNENVTFS